MDIARCVSAYIGIDEFVDRSKNVLVTGDVVEGVGTVFLDPKLSDKSQSLSKQTPTKEDYPGLRQANPPQLSSPFHSCYRS